MYISQVYQIPQDPTACYDHLQDNIYLKPPAMEHGSLFVCSNPSNKDEGMLVYSPYNEYPGGTSTVPFPPGEVPPSYMVQTINCGSIIPPPPLFPIINPVVYNNNEDVGSFDFHYISSDDFALLNAHQSSISIPRITTPPDNKSPRELIPSLLPPTNCMPLFYSNLLDLNSLREHHENSTNPSTTHKPISKVHIIGFSWTEPSEMYDNCNDVWVRKD